ncbi:hypothetical protein CHARACLAT_027879 [Characodon lateralis]|uniref:Leptin receptor n=1 Tax=Characodon lateralis TaxID=208331 RepID=A0ABU7D1X5_9TELE|nr:hypothetical protein [Characodon lateralis]
MSKKGGFGCESFNASDVLIYPESILPTEPYQCKSADNIPVSLDRLILSLWSSTRGLPEAFVHLQLVWSEHPHVWTELRFTPTFHLSAAFHGPVVVQVRRRQIDSNMLTPININ